MLSPVLYCVLNVTKTFKNKSFMVTVHKES